VPSAARIMSICHSRPPIPQRCTRDGSKGGMSLIAKGSAAFVRETALIDIRGRKHDTVLEYLSGPHEQIDTGSLQRVQEALFASGAFVATAIFFP